jgi:hypothetical protein
MSMKKALTQKNAKCAACRLLVMSAWLDYAPCFSPFLWEGFTQQAMQYLLVHWAWTQGLHLEPLHQLFCVRYFQDRVLQTIHLILLISAFWIARFTDVSHRHPASRSFKLHHLVLVSQVIIDFLLCFFPLSCLPLFITTLYDFVNFSCYKSPGGEYPKL